MNKHPVHRDNNPPWAGKMASAFPSLYNTKVEESKEVLTCFETMPKKIVVT
jgi:hypothetical protein